MANSKITKSRLRPGEPGYVGRGVPPIHSQIQPGETKNPWGRRGKPSADGVPVDFNAQVAALLAAPIPAKDGKYVTTAELAINKLLKKVNAEDLASIKYYFELREKYPVKTSLELAEEVSDVRLRLIEEALTRREAKRAFAQAPGDQVPQVEKDLANDHPSDPERS